MTPNTLRRGPGGPGARMRGSTHYEQTARLSRVVRCGAGDPRHAGAQTAGSGCAAGLAWSLLLPSYSTKNSTEEAMPDPDAGPSHEPGARILGARS